MPWYRRKREDVEAWQLTHENYDDGGAWPDWIMEVWQLDREHHFQSLVRAEFGGRGLALYTRDERAMVRVGDYITRDPAGRLTHVAGAAFEATHTEVEAERDAINRAIERAAKAAREAIVEIVGGPWDGAPNGYRVTVHFNDAAIGGKFFHSAHTAAFGDPSPDPGDEIVGELLAKIGILEEENRRLSTAVCSGILGDLLADDESAALADFIKSLRARAALSAISGDR